MPKLIDLTGRKYGKLTVLNRVRNKGRYTMWKCQCECGVTGVYRGSSLTTRNTSSCGCSKLDHGHAGSLKKERSAEYATWNHMLQRCNNPKQINYKNYGGRGIKVCERWHTFENFLKDMGEKPSPKHSIDRIDVNRDYEPSNCRWATRFEQDTNKRVSKKNKTGVKGVYFESQTLKYRACIGYKGKTYRSSRYNTIKEAKEARKELERKYWGKSSL